MAFIDVFAEDASDIRSLQVNFKGLDGYSHMNLTGAVELSYELLMFEFHFPGNDDLSLHSMMDAHSSLIISLANEYEGIFYHPYVYNERNKLEIHSLDTLLYTNFVLQLAPSITQELEDATIDSQYVKSVNPAYMGFILGEYFDDFLRCLMNVQEQPASMERNSYICGCIWCTKGRAFDYSEEERAYYSQDPNFKMGMKKCELDKINKYFDRTYRLLVDDYSTRSERFYEKLHYNRLVSAKILQAKELRTLPMPPVLGERSWVSAIRMKVGGVSIGRLKFVSGFAGVSSGRLKFVSGFLMGGVAFASIANAKSRASP